MEEYGLLTYKNRVYIPNIADLMRMVMDEIHQAPYSGHPGYQKTIATARKQYFWPQIKKDMDEYISRCMKCQQVKVDNQWKFNPIYRTITLTKLPIKHAKLTTKETEIGA